MKKHLSSAPSIRVRRRRGHAPSERKTAIAAILVICAVIIAVSAALCCKAGFPACSAQRTPPPQNEAPRISRPLFRNCAKNAARARARPLPKRRVSRPMCCRGSRRRRKVSRKECSPRRVSPRPLTRCFLYFHARYRQELLQKAFQYLFSDNFNNNVLLAAAVEIAVHYVLARSEVEPSLRNGNGHRPAEQHLP